MIKKPKPTTPEEYKAAREERGTQEYVAQLLGVSRVAVARREAGMRPVSREAWLALLSLPKISSSVPLSEEPPTRSKRS